VVRGEFPVAAQIQVALGAADRKEPADLRSDGVRTRLEVTECGARAAVAGELLIEVADAALVGACIVCGQRERSPARQRKPGGQRLCMVAVPQLTLLLAARVIRYPRITGGFDGPAQTSRPPTHIRLVVHWPFGLTTVNLQASGDRPRSPWMSAVD